MQRKFSVPSFYCLPFWNNCSLLTPSSSDQFYATQTLCKEFTAHIELANKHSRSSLSGTMDTTIALGKIVDSHLLNKSEISLLHENNNNTPIKLTVLQMVAVRDSPH